MSLAGYTGNLNPTAPVFLPANLQPIPFFIPTTIYLSLPLPPPHCPSFHSIFAGALPPPPLPDFHPTSFTPTRALVLLPVPTDVTETSLRRDLEVFGEVRGVQMERADEGIVTVHFYDLRDSQRALREIRDCHMHHHHHQRFGYTAARGGLVSGTTVWAHFVFPQLTAVPGGNNQGSLVVMNLKPTVSSTTLRRIFKLYGEVKELRETPFKKEQRFVEFFDVRDAALALREMDGKSIDGKPILIQFSRPGGLSRKFFLASRFNKSFLFNNHYQPPPPPHYHRRLPSPAIKVKPSTQRYDQPKTNKNKRSMKKKKMNVKDNGCFTINEDANFGAGRTTVMIRNIPNKYTHWMFLEMMDTHCNECNQKIIMEGNNTPMSSYDFVYLPIDFKSKCNLGYAFVNMTTPEAVLRLYKAFHNQHWSAFKSRKICEVAYARIQGIELVKEHFRNLRLPGVEMVKLMPVVFSPPRDGRLLTVPVSIGVDLGTKPVEDSCHSSDETETVMSCSSSDKSSDGSDGCFLGERIKNGGVCSDDESINSDV